MIQEEKQSLLKGCKDCWHNYHCPMLQEGYNFNLDTCPYNSDNKRENYDTRKKMQAQDNVQNLLKMAEKCIKHYKSLLK